MLGNLIGGFIVILIGVNLIDPLGDSIYSAKFNASGSPTNVTGTSATLLDITLIFFALGIMSAGVSLAVGGLRNAGIV